MTHSRFERQLDPFAVPWSRRAALAGAAGLFSTLAPGVSAAPASSLQGTSAPGATAGVTTQVLGQREAADAPGQALSLRRIVFQPGASLSPHSHPGSTIYWIESGTLSFTLLAGEASFVRSGTDGPTATPAAGEAIRAGTEITVTAGDVLTFGNSAAQSERALGNEPVVILLTNLGPIGAPFREPIEGTPPASS